MQRSTIADGPRLRAVVFGIAMIAIVASRASAAVIVTSTVNSNSPIVFGETGVFLDAGNFFGPNTLRGTNNFVAKTLPNPGGASPQTVSTTNGLTVVMAGVTDGLHQIDLGSGTDDLYLTEFFTPDQSGAYLTFSGLNPTLTYQFQFPHGENRMIPYTATQQFKDSSNTIATKTNVR